jgi:hypothetical protein
VKQESSWKTCIYCKAKLYEVVEKIIWSRKCNKLLPSWSLLSSYNTSPLLRKWNNCPFMYTFGYLQLTFLFLSIITNEKQRFINLLKYVHSILNHPVHTAYYLEIGHNLLPSHMLNSSSIIILPFNTICIWNLWSIAKWTMIKTIRISLYNLNFDTVQWAFWLWT